jgi:hypothetical protein
VSTLCVGTDIVQSHVILCPSRLSLKEDGLPVSTSRTGMFLGLWKGRVMDDLWDDPGQFVHVMSDLVDVDTVVVGDLFVVTVPTGIQ